MEPRYLIDSNAVIDYLDNKLTEKGMAFMNFIIDEVPNVSVITKIEVLRFEASPAIYRILTNFMNVSMIYNLNENIVNTTIKLCKQYRIKLPDAIIAATSIVNDFTLITRNAKDFDRIVSLKTHNPHII